MTVKKGPIIGVIRSALRAPFGVLFLALSIAGAIFIAGAVVGLRLNTTPSEPLGLWRIVPLDRPLKIGDVIFICPTNDPVMREALARGYFRSGLCQGGFSPLIKAVAALPGQNIDIGRTVEVDGVLLAHSTLKMTDAKGRALSAWKGGVVPRRTVFLHSDFPGSFDSRYFGPLPQGNILGLARQVWTHAP